MFRQLFNSIWIVALAVDLGLGAGAAPAAEPGTGFRLGNGMRITSVTPSAPASRPVPGLRIAADTPSMPQPPVAGFSPLVAITTSDRRSSDDFNWEHTLVSSYVGRPLNPPAEQNFVVGVLDTGSTVDLAAGASAGILGLQGRYLTPSVTPIGGIAGTMDAMVTMPIGVFAAGLEAVTPEGRLDLSKVIGHTNVSALAAPPIECADGTGVSAVVGTPLLAFYTTIIHVDRPRKAIVRDKTFISPDVQITTSYDPSPAEYRRRIPMELGGLSPVTTANYFAFPDFEDILGEWLPLTPTLLSMSAMSLPTGGAFFAEVGVLQGPPGPLNALQTTRMLVDTGAQSSVISSNIAAKLNLPLEPDFTAEVCGVGGSTVVPGYYVDYVRINAMGGALEFARVPFVVIDMESPEGGSLDGILGMNFFWNRNLVLEPTTSGTGFLHLSEPVPFAYIDLNRDDVVDLLDYAVFAAAWRTTPADPAWNPRCDLFMDEVIDTRDLEAFMDSWLHMVGNAPIDAKL
ncbi:MAG: aspartyl protease family protein [Planctomycetes bacterium]|jgi:hypothetical protein|nr:aspartyl protease family protein [Planctomycetota bacterium]